MSNPRQCNYYHQPESYTETSERQLLSWLKLRGEGGNCVRLQCWGLELFDILSFIKTLYCPPPCLVWQVVGYNRCRIILPCTWPDLTPQHKRVTNCHWLWLWPATFLEIPHYTSLYSIQYTSPQHVISGLRNWKKEKKYKKLLLMQNFVEIEKEL